LSVVKGKIAMGKTAKMRTAIAIIITIIRLNKEKVFNNALKGRFFLGIVRLVMILFT